MLVEEDGITHINVYSKGKTELGRLLTNFAFTPFKGVHGTKYSSAESAWYWGILSGWMNDYEDKKLRSLYGFAAKKYGKELISKYKGRKGFTIETNTEQFKKWFLEIIRCKLRQNKKILKMLRDSDLPLKHYYYYGRTNGYIVYELPEFDWITEELERLRVLLKEAKQ